MAASSAFTCFVVLLMIPLLATSMSALPLKKKTFLKVAKEINCKGPYIGLVTVYAPEENAFFATGAFRPNHKHPFVDLSGRRFRVGSIHGKKVIYVRCGVGMVNAAAATQQMLDVFNIAGIVHFGISGNVNNSMSIGDVVIPNQFANTGLWNWMNPNGTLDPSDVTLLEIGNYNVPEGDGLNQLGKVGYSTEQFFSASGDPGTAKSLFWMEVTDHWLHFATGLEGVELKSCVNSSTCLPQKPKLVVGLKGSTSNTFLDNAAYRDFLFHTFEVSSADMESSSVVMTSLSNGFPVIVIRGLSDLAGGQSGENAIDTFGSLAAQNTAEVVLKFVSRIPASVLRI